MDNEKAARDKTLRQAKIYFASGQLQKSIEYFSLAEERGHELSLVWVSRGAAYMALGDYVAARDDFSRVLNEDPNNERALYFRGVAMVALGEYEKAIDDLTRSLTQNNDRGIAHLMRGVAYNELGQEFDAELDINSAASFSTAEFSSFSKVFGNLPDAFKKSKALLGRENAPWNNLLSRESRDVLLEQTG